METDFCFFHESNTFICWGTLTILSAQCIVGSSAMMSTVPASFTSGKYITLEAESWFGIFLWAYPSTLKKINRKIIINYMAHIKIIFWQH